MTNESREDAGADLLREERRSPAVKIICLAAAAAVIGAGAWWYFGRDAGSDVRFVTQKAVRGPIDVTVSADGTLNPVRTVSLGSELSGIVSKVNVDVNDPIKVGQVLIELDTRKLKAQVAQYSAAVHSAEADRDKQVATLREAQLKLKRMNELNRLSGGKMPSRTELETQQASVDTAKAAVNAAKASIDDAKASLSTAETDLSKAQIKSPIDGVVLTRSVEPGYAVAATLQAVELLTLATDLRKLELQVSVDEADIGVVKPGQEAYFTVGAYPNKRFPATLKKVAYGATTTENVVTYTTYLDVDNADMLLRPGMTASVTISTAHKDNALMVPNSAFRFTPKLQKSGSAVNFHDADAAAPRRREERQGRDAARREGAHDLGAPQRRARQG
jgi:HlyD family secretion protein